MMSIGLGELLIIGLALFALIGLPIAIVLVLLLNRRKDGDKGP